VHLDPGLGVERRDHLAFDGQVDLGGEVVALLLHRGFGAVAFDERPRGGVKDCGCLRDKCVEVGLVQRHRGPTAPPRPAPAAA